MSNLLLSKTYDALAVVDDAGERLNQGWLSAIMRDIEAAPRKVAAIQAAVARHPHKLTFGTLKTTYYLWRENGDEALIDKRKLKKFVKQVAWVECFMTYCERNNRNNKAAWKVMLQEMWEGKALPGVGTWREAWRAQYPDRAVPSECPFEWIPIRAKYNTLQNKIKRNPDYLFCIAASRKGRKEAHQYLLPVLKTRTGLEVGQLTEYDDVTVDVEINMPGIGQTARPQMFVGYDIASGFKIIDCVRPQYPETKGEKRNSLKEREFRMMHSYELTMIGIHPGGSRKIVEHGTTAIRPTLEKRIKKIPVYGDLLTYERSGILAEAVHAGLFKGDGGGNFRFKGYCEQAHRNAHAARAALPGQVGQDADHRPESHAALVRYDMAMMAAVQNLPEDVRERVIYNLLDWPTFERMNYRLTDAIMDDADHRLEGWDDKMIMCFKRFEGERWRPISELQDMEGPERDDILRHLAVCPAHKMIRRMTRREAYNAGSHKLVRIPMFELPMMLDERLIKEGGDARLITVRKGGVFGFNDEFYYGGDEVLFHATIKTRTGFQHALVPGQEYVFFGTPYHTEGGVICDKESGNVIGLAPAYKRAATYDREAVLRAAGAQNADLAAKLLTFRGRHQPEAKQRLAMIGQNVDLLKQANGGAADPIVDCDDIPDAMDRAASAFVQEPVEA
jgi:hypothetical protein